MCVLMPLGVLERENMRKEAHLFNDKQIRGSIYILLCKCRLCYLHLFTQHVARQQFRTQIAPCGRQLPHDVSTWAR